MDAKIFATYLVESYQTITGTQFENSEVKLQKMMYFAQKNALALTGEPLFDEDFEGWVHGPVLKSLRFFFESLPNEDITKELNDTQKYIIDNTIQTYGQYSTWKLRDMSHAETSWIKSRDGLNESEQGRAIIPVEDIREDAKNIRIYDHQFDMYVDEFPDLDEKEFEPIG